MWYFFVCCKNILVMKKVCLVSSCGGHFMELMQIIPAVSTCDFYIVTERNIASRKILDRYKHHYLIQQERKSVDFYFKFLFNIVLSLFFLLKERPNIIITTGAGAAYPTCRLGKWLGKKIIYIESFAKINTSSVTGKMVYPFADYFLIQWPEMTYIYPKALYYGTVY